MTHSALHVRFPGESFVSQTEFDQFCQREQAVLEARFAYEQRLIPPEGAPEIIREGTCAPCLRVTRFTTRVTTDGAPNWREAQQCDCPDRLGNRARAALHFLESVAGLADWSRVLLFGPPDVLDRRLSAGRPGFVRQPRLHAEGDGFRLDGPDGAFHAVICWDHLHHVPPLGAALAEIRRVLAPGGSFVFTVPLRYRATHTVSHLEHARHPGGGLVAELGTEVHEIGWDMLDMLREAGFIRPLVHHTWSEELGYLGPFNLLFSASA